MPTKVEFKFNVRQRVYIVVYERFRNLCPYCHTGSTTTEYCRVYSGIIGYLTGSVRFVEGKKPLEPYLSYSVDVKNYRTFTVSEPYSIFATKEEAIKEAESRCAAKSKSKASKKSAQSSGSEKVKSPHIWSSISDPLLKK